MAPAEERSGVRSGKTAGTEYHHRYQPFPHLTSHLYKTIDIYRINGLLFKVLQSVMEEKL
jgi:hypothetical protein